MRNSKTTVTPGEAVGIEVILSNYLLGYDDLNPNQKRYVLESLQLWYSCGLLRLAYKLEGGAKFGKLKYGAICSASVRSGIVTIDLLELEKEVESYERYGPLKLMPSTVAGYYEVMLNLSVSHGFAQQIRFCLSQDAQDHIQKLFESRLTQCDTLHPLPEVARRSSELVRDAQDQRCFISGWARQSWHHYWAESMAAYSVKECREKLRNLDLEIYDVISELIFHPEKLLSPRIIETLEAIQRELREANQFSLDFAGR